MKKYKATYFKSEPINWLGSRNIKNVPNISTGWLININKSFEIQTWTINEGELMQANNVFFILTWFLNNIGSELVNRLISI